MATDLSQVSPAPRNIPRGYPRDTAAWRFQVWASFGIAAALCVGGLLRLPGDSMVSGFMIMGYVFSLSAVFVLSKAVRDNQHGAQDTPMWGLVAWGGFAVAVALTGWGLLRMDIESGLRAYLAVSWLFLVSSAFTLAKTLRDRHDADLAEGIAGRRAARRADGELPADAAQS